MQMCSLQVSFILDQLEQVQLSHHARHRHHHHRHRHPFAGRPVVILADRDKEDMDKLVQNCSATKPAMHTLALPAASAAGVHRLLSSRAEWSWQASALVPGSTHAEL